MPHYQYACPDCGLTRQSKEDLSGKEINCLGCQAVFVATSLKAANWGKPAEIVAKPAVTVAPVPSPAVSPPTPTAVVKNEPAPTRLTATAVSIVSRAPPMPPRPL